MPNLTLCYSSGRQEHNSHMMMYSPLALAYLAHHTPKHYNLQFYDEYVDIQLDASKIKTDLVAISTQTFGINRAYEIAGKLKKRGIYSVIGGSHASALPEEALQHFDTVIKGEGELPWKQFLSDFENGIPSKIYDGKMNSPLDHIGTPDRRFTHPAYYYPSIQTSRGCPFNCSFCYLNIYDNRRYRTVPHDYILEDFEAIKHNPIVIVCDENFIGYDEEDFEDRKILLEKMIRKNYKFHWGCQSSVNLGNDKELMKLMYRAGCRAVFMGLETSLEEGLDEVNKDQNKNVDYKYLIKQIHKNKIAVIASVIFGLDSHRPGHQKLLAKELKNMKADFADITLMGAFPGTALFKDLENEGRVTRDWDLVHLKNPYLKYKNFSHEEIIRAREEILKSFYNTVNVTKIIFRWIWRERALLKLFIKMVRRKHFCEKHRKIEHQQRQENKKLKLLLINPVNSEDTFSILNPKASKSNSTAFVAPLGLGYLAAATPPEWKISLIDENIAPFEYEEADLVAITAHTGQASRAFELAGIYKKAKIPVVIGGIHASFLPSEASQYADTIVTGEAEVIWPTILKDFLEGNIKKRYDAGLADVTLNNKPLRSIFSEKYKVGSISTSRGCPFGCNFCTITIFNGSKLRRRPPQYVVDEMITIPQKYLFVVDDNLIGYSETEQEDAKELFREIIRRGVKKKWVCQTSINSVQDEEVLMLARKAGCIGMFIGMESVNKDILKRMNKKANLNTGVEMYKETVKKVNKYGMAVMGNFVTGYEKNLDEMEAETEWMRKSPVDIVNFAILTPFPGTKMYSDLEEQDRIMLNDYPSDWQYYTKDYPVFKMDYLSVEELYVGLKYRVKIIYNYRVIARRFIRTLWRTRSFNTAIISLFVNIFWSRRKNIKRVSIFESFVNNKEYMNKMKGKTKVFEKEIA